MAQPKKDKDELIQLRKKVEELSLEVETLRDKMKNSQKSKKSQKKSTWKKTVVGISVAFATLLLVFGNIFFWTGRTIVDTNRYVATVGPLIKQPAIQTGIAQYTTTALYNNYNVQGYIQQVLPPRAAFLAPELATQLKTYTQSTIKSLLANSKVQKYWYSSLTNSHTRLINFAKNYHGNGEITISNIYSQLSKRLESTPLSFLANKPLPAKVGSIQVTTVRWLPALSTLVNNIDLWEFIAVVLFIASLAIAVILSSKKLRLIVKVGLIFAGLMLITIIAVRVMRSVVLSNINQTYKAAGQAAYDTIMNSFITQTINILIISLVISILAWLEDKFKFVDWLKPKIREYKEKIVPTKATKK